MRYLEIITKCKKINSTYYSLTLTVIAENGGFRELNTPTGHTQDYFYGQSSTKSTMFRFDSIKPYHCLLDKPNPCSSKALDVTEDITKVQCIT